MTLELTKKQTQILNFINDFMSSHDYSPSYREIMSGLGLSSVSAVSEHIDNLVMKGALKKVPGAARSLEIVDSNKNKETIDLFKSRLLTASEEEKEVLLKAAKLLELNL